VPPCDVSVEAESYILTYKQETPLGTLEVRFKPSEGFNKIALDVGKDLTDNMLCSRMQGQDGSMSFGDPENAPQKKEERSEAIAIWFKMFFAHILSNNLTLVLRHTFDDAAHITAATCLSLQVRCLGALKGIKSVKTSGVNEQMKAIAEHVTKDKKDLLNSYRDAVAPTQFKDVSIYYEKLLPVWRDIQQIAKTHVCAWREMVEAKYQNKIIVFEDSFNDLFVEDLTDDLLKRITGNTRELSDDELLIIETHDGDDTPSSVALEHAARLCGAWRYQYSARYLFQKVTELRNAAEFSK
jgi:hypothetical protein